MSLWIIQIKLQRALTKCYCHFKQVRRCGKLFEIYRIQSTGWWIHILVQATGPTGFAWTGNWPPGILPVGCQPAFAIWGSTLPVPKNTSHRPPGTSLIPIRIWAAKEPGNESDSDHSFCRWLGTCCSFPFWRWLPTCLLLWLLSSQSFSVSLSRLFLYPCLSVSLSLGNRCESFGHLSQLGWILFGFIAICVLAEWHNCK